MKYIKKLAAALAAAALCAVLAGCAASTTTVSATLETSSAVEGEEAQVEVKNPENYENDIQGLCKFFEDSKLVAGDKVQMSFDVIGALNGYKYAFRYNESNVQIELYEFGSELNDAAKAVVESVKANGNFDVLGNTVPGVLSDDGRFLMVYTDTKIADDEVSRVHYERALDQFGTFAARAE